MAEKTDEERVSIWSVHGRHRYLFSVCSFLLFIIGIVAVLCLERTAFGSIYSTAKLLVTLGACAVTVCFMLYEGVTTVTLAADYVLKRREQKGIEKGRKEAYDQWIEWYRNKYPDQPLPPFVANGTDHNGSATSDE